MSTPRAILDSSPLRLPAQRTDTNALKRSASTASLPTPPRTVRRRGSAADDSDEEDAALPVLSSDFEVPPDAGGAHKRRRVDAVAAALTQAEEAFWLDLPAAASSKPHDTASEKPRTKERATRIPRPRRVPGADKVRPRAAAAARIAAQSKASAFSLLTPPASRHRPPTTPRPRKAKAKAKGMPVRDSPHNPFLAPASPRPAPPRPSAAQRAEQPTLTYVFRGKKQEFVNPHYGAGRSARAALPVSHPDFSPSDNCTPRRLFAPRGRAASPELWESEEEGEGAGEGPRMTLAAEFARVGEAGGRGLLERVLEGDEEDE